MAENNKSKPNTATHVCVGGIDTVLLTRKQLADQMVRDCLSSRQSSKPIAPKLVFSSNGQGVALAAREQSFARLIDKAEIVHADGMSIVYASHLTRTPIPERIATTDFFHDAARAAMEQELKFFILGGTEKENCEAVQSIAKMYPKLKIAGRHHGYFDESMDATICAAIKESHADVLWVGLGRPRQEQWCVNNQTRLMGVAWVKTCGGLYSFLAGRVSRAPEWMQRFGLEWLYRVYKEPRRLLWRYMTTNPYAAYRLIRFTHSHSQPKSGT